MEGIIAANKQANAAQLRYIPVPYDTSMPDKMPLASCIVLMLSSFLTIAVQMAAAIRMNSADRMDIVVEKKKKTVLRSIPANNENAANSVPSNRK